MGAINSAQYNAIWIKPPTEIIDGPLYMVKKFDGNGVCKDTQFNRSADQAREAQTDTKHTVFVYDQAKLFRWCKHPVEIC